MGRKKHFRSLAHDYENPLAETSLLSALIRGKVEKGTSLAIHNTIDSELVEFATVNERSR